MFQCLHNLTDLEQWIKVFCTTLIYFAPSGKSVCAAWNIHRLIHLNDKTLCKASFVIKSFANLSNKSRALRK